MADTNNATKTEAPKAPAAAAPAPARAAPARRTAAADTAPAPTAMATRTEDVVVRGRVADTTAPSAKRKVEKTGDRTHIATARGYSIVDGGGVLIEPGEFVPAGTPISLAPDDRSDDSDPRAVAGVGWMKKVAKKDRDLLDANAEALDEKPKDVDLTQLGVPALQALCALVGINPGKLDKDELIAAYNAHREKDAG